MFKPETFIFEKMGQNNAVELVWSVLAGLVRRFNQKCLPNCSKNLENSNKRPLNLVQWRVFSWVSRLDIWFSKIKGYLRTFSCLVLILQPQIKRNIWDERSILGYHKAERTEESGSASIGPKPRYRKVLCVSVSARSMRPIHSFCTTKQHFL